MKIPFAFMLALSMSQFLVATPARAADDGVTVTATVQPKSVASANLKPDKAVDVTVTYVITNHTAVTQVLNSYSTIQADFLGDDGRPVVMQDMGADGTGEQKAFEILVIAPGKQETLKLTVSLSKPDTHAGIMLIRMNDDGEYCGGGLPKASKFMDIKATYANPLTRDQIEKLRPELAGVKYALPEIKLPAVRVAFTK